MLRILKLTKQSLLLALVLAMVSAAAILPGPVGQQPSAATAVQVSNQQFVRYIEEWSEPEGFFDSDNFISNETSYLHVIGQLRQQVKPGGVYLGVGPDQNFSYIAHMRPALAIITDIRRQNLLQHLWFKALFSMARNRAEYLALLTSREFPAVKTDAPLRDVLAAVRGARTDASRFGKNLNAVKSILLDKYRLKLSSQDLSRIEYTYRTFSEEGLDLRFSSFGRNNALTYPTLEDILLETDRQGRQLNFLSSEDLFQWLKKFQAENRLIPVVGDFAGPHALKTVGAFLSANKLQISAFYTSNVEYYLFGQPAWRRFVENIRMLPMGPDSVFIRSYFSNAGPPHPLNLAGHRATSLVKPVARFLQDNDIGGFGSYWDVVKP